MTQPTFIVVHTLLDDDQGDCDPINFGPFGDAKSAFQFASSQAAKFCRDNNDLFFIDANDREVRYSELLDSDGEHTVWVEDVAQWRVTTLTPPTE